MAKGTMKLANLKIHPKPDSLTTSAINDEIRNNKVHFSFSYFKQIPNFEIGSCSNKWFISLIERVQNLSGFPLSFFIEGNKGGDSLRFHAINWDTKKIPIQRSDCSWIPEVYLDNDADYPFMQFALSIGQGRIVGFFDRNIFYIILFDINHNIQPSKKTNYSIQKTSIGVSQFDKLLNKLDHIKYIVKACSDKDCLLHKQIDDIDVAHDNIVYVNLDDDFYAAYDEIIQEKTLKDIFEAGIYHLTENN